MHRVDNTSLRRHLTISLFKRENIALPHFFKLLHNTNLPFDEFKSLFLNHIRYWNLMSWSDPDSGYTIFEILASHFDASFIELTLTHVKRVKFEYRNHSLLYFAIFNPHTNIQQSFIKFNNFFQSNDGTTLAHTYAAFNNLENFKSCGDEIFISDHRNKTCSYYAGLACSKQVARYLFSDPKFDYDSNPAMYACFTAGLADRFNQIKHDSLHLKQLPWWIEQLQEMIQLFYTIYPSELSYSAQDFVLIIKLTTHLIIALEKTGKQNEITRHLARLDQLFHYLLNRKLPNIFYIALNSLTSTTLAQAYFEKACIDQGITTLVNLEKKFNEIAHTSRFKEDYNLMSMTRLIHQKIELARFAKKYGLYCAGYGDNRPSTIFDAIIKIRHHLPSQFCHLSISELRHLTSNYIKVNRDIFKGNMDTEEFYDYCIAVKKDAYGDINIISALSSLLEISLCVMFSNNTITYPLQQPNRRLIILGCLSSDSNIKYFVPLIRHPAIPALRELFTHLEDDSIAIAPPSQDAFILVDDYETDKQQACASSSQSVPRP